MNFNKTSTKFASVLMSLLCLSVLAGCKKEDGNKTPTDKVYTESELLDLSVRIADGKNGVVAAANPYAANCGLKVLQAGGNAFDAAVAVSFGLGLCEPHASGIGGGGILVGYDATAGEFVSYNFREFVPANYDCTQMDGDTYKDPNTGNDLSKAAGGVNEWGIGVNSIGVPTIVSSLLGIMDQRGNFNDNAHDREVVIGPARDYAKNGFTVTQELQGTIATNPCWQDTAEGKAIYGVNGKKMALNVGDTLINANLGKVYDEIITKGKDGFYKGWVADAIVAACGSTSAPDYWGKSGFMTQADLDYACDNYPQEDTPVTGNYRGYDIVSSAPPSSGGLILIEALNMLEVYDNLAESKYGQDKLTDLGHNSPEYINILSTASQLAYGDKQKWVGDDSPNPLDEGKPFQQVPTLGMTNKQYAAARFTENYTPGQQYNGKYSTLTNSLVSSSSIDSTTGGVTYNKNSGRADWYDPNMPTYKKNLAGTIGYDEDDYGEHYSTTSFSIADKFGNVVSITQTINHFFGAHVMPAGTGFYMNNQLSSFSKSATSASYFMPYKHPTSHIMPTIILKDGEAVATLGSPGSMRLVSAVFETVVNMIDWHFNADTQTWVARQEDQELEIQPAIEGARLYSYCVSTSDNGGLSDEDQALHKPLYLEVEAASDTKATIVKKSDITQDTVDALTNDYGYAVQVTKGRALFFGGVQGITFDSNRVMHGGADIRRDGKALGY